MSPAHQPRRFWRLTYPRTGSNLLERILALEDQPSIVTGPRQRTGYFFMPSIVLRLVKLKTAGRHIDTLTVGERTQLMESYQACFEDLQQHVNTAEAHGKDVYVKEHAPWLMEPLAETKSKFGKDSTRETPWTVNAFEQQTHSPRNETVLPDEFLKTWLPTFLIRHPALAFPSAYRKTMARQGRGDGVTLTPSQDLESRALYDWYIELFKDSGQPSGWSGVTWPIVLDAEDVMTNPEMVVRYSEIVGFDTSKIRFSWDPASKEELERMPGHIRRMRSTIDGSHGIVQGKTAKGLDMDEEVAKWKAEFGDEGGVKVEKWVRAAMPDYEYMRAKRLAA